MLTEPRMHYLRLLPNRWDQCIATTSGARRVLLVVAEGPTRSERQSWWSRARHKVCVQRHWNSRGPNIERTTSALVCQLKGFVGSQCINIPRHFVSDDPTTMHTHQSEHSIAAPLRSGPAQWPIFVLCWRELGHWRWGDGRGAGRVGRRLEKRGYSKAQSQTRPRQISSMPI